GEQPPWYRRTATHYVTSAKTEETRTRRLRKLIDLSAEGKRMQW
ncbi:MAG TPA: YdeI/OmpD-associated family protein, partial [Thermoanaerobaculia bacterium]|nr:YdeI/OmpD-associated family protein [Thermoanaerobaculia bacterium]